MSSVAGKAFCGKLLVGLLAGSSMSKSGADSGANYSTRVVRPERKLRGLHRKS
jgi:hypothetical protein